MFNISIVLHYFLCYQQLCCVTIQASASDVDCTYIDIVGRKVDMAQLKDSNW